MMYFIFLDVAVYCFFFELFPLSGSLSGVGPDNSWVPTLMSSCIQILLIEGQNASRICQHLTLDSNIPGWRIYPFFCTDRAFSSCLESGIQFLYLPAPVPWPLVSCNWFDSLPTHILYPWCYSSSSYYYSSISRFQDQHKGYTWSRYCLLSYDDLTLKCHSSRPQSAHKLFLDDLSLHTCLFFSW